MNWVHVLGVVSNFGCKTVALINFNLIAQQGNVETLKQDLKELRKENDALKWRLKRSKQIEQQPTINNTKAF